MKRKVKEQMILPVLLFSPLPFFVIESRMPVKDDLQ
jgi:hypothetical protein